MRKCVCDGMYEGCEHKMFCGADVTDDRWGPWCAECNPRRMAHISASLASMKASLEPKQ
jgi:hypothetical protein